MQGSPNRQLRVDVLATQCRLMVELRAFEENVGHVRHRTWTAESESTPLHGQCPPRFRGTLAPRTDLCQKKRHIDYSPQGVLQRRGRQGTRPNTAPNVGQLDA